MIRIATTDDYDQIGKLRVDVYKAYFKQNTNVEKRVKDLTRFTDPDTIIIVYEQDNRIIGTAEIDLQNNPKYPEFPSNSAYITHLAVDKNYRRHGIATQLINHMDNMAGIAGRSNLVLRTADNMIEAQKFYIKNGFFRNPKLDYKYPNQLLLAYTRDITD